MSQSDFTRRHFLKVPAAAVGSAALLTAQSPSDTVRVAFIGVGNRGSYLLRNMLKVPGVKVTVICDINPETLNRAIDAAKTAGQSPEGIAEWRRVLDRQDIDAIVVATPVDLHKEMAIASLESGRNLYCEKPMALTPAENFLLVADAGSGDVAVVRLAPMPRGEKISAAEAFIKGQNPSKPRALVTIIPVGSSPADIAIKTLR